MSNHLDSRALYRGDCYAQRFMKAGTYPYNVVPAHGQALNSEYPFTIRVEEPDKKTAMVQHTLLVAPGAKTFSVNDTNIAIKVGDLVLWSSGSPSHTPFAVVGKHDFFSSYRMTNECGFSHAFGTAGDFQWKDAFGSGISGVIRVKNPDCSSPDRLRSWQDSLASGTVIMINEGKSDKTQVDILVGQRVFFAVVKGPGISVTQVELLDAAKANRGCVEGEPGASAR